MEEESFGIREAFKREPEQTNFLIKLVLGGGIVVAVFSVVAAVLVSSIMVLPVALILALIYAAAVVFATARLIFSGVGRRYMESAMHNRTPGQVQESATAMAPIAEQASFNQSYFMLRLQDEVASARRDGREMTVIAIEATVPGMEIGPESVEKVAKEIAEIASNHHKTISHTLSVSESEYVMSLPETSGTDAKLFLSNLVQSLGNYWCHFGTASYPKDGTTADGLIRFARESVDESRQGKGSKSHAVA
jgi:membrane protein implicated in regulation of membrane protease activity